MCEKKIEVKKMPDGCRGHLFLGYNGCQYCKVDPNQEDPKAYCQWDKEKTNLIMFVGKRPSNCPLVLQEK